MTPKEGPPVPPPMSARIVAWVVALFGGSVTKHEVKRVLVPATCNRPKDNADSGLINRPVRMDNARDLTKHEGLTYFAAEVAVVRRDLGRFSLRHLEAILGTVP